MAVLVLSLLPALVVASADGQGQSGQVCGQGASATEGASLLAVRAPLRKVVFEGTESSGQSDPSKCLENGGFDSDCCAKESEASCADGYVRVMSGIYCWGQTYAVYMCYEPGLEPSSDPEPSACLENGGFDNDCCAKPSEAGCGDGYTLQLSGTFCANGYERYACYSSGTQGPTPAPTPAPPTPAPTPAPPTPAPPTPAPTTALWLQLGEDHTRCRGDNIKQSVDSQAACQAKAEEAGVGFYQYNWDNGRCVWTDTCNSPKTGTKQDWRIYSAALVPTPAPPTPVGNYTAMLGGQPCEQLCVMEYRGKCAFADTSVGKAPLVKDREGCMHYYSWGKDGTLTPCTINRGGKCHKNVNKGWKCWDYVTEDTLRAACAAAGASPDVEPWASFS